MAAAALAGRSPASHCHAAPIDSAAWRIFPGTAPGDAVSWPGGQAAGQGADGDVQVPDGGCQGRRRLLAGDRRPMAAARRPGAGHLAQGRASSPGRLAPRSAASSVTRKH